MPEILSLFWLILLIGFVVAEAMTTALVSIWFAAGTLVALILSLFKLPLWLQIAAFLIIAILLLIATRPFARKFLEPKITKTNFDRIIGEECIVDEAISNLNGTGTVKIKGALWTARSEDGTDISSGSVVKIIRIEGVKVFVSNIK